MSWRSAWSCCSSQMLHWRSLVQRIGNFIVADLLIHLSSEGERKECDSCAAMEKWNPSLTQKERMWGGRKIQQKLSTATIPFGLNVCFCYQDILSQDNLSWCCANLRMKKSLSPVSSHASHLTEYIDTPTGAWVLHEWMTHHLLGRAPLCFVRLLASLSALATSLTHIEHNSSQHLTSFYCYSPAYSINHELSGWA
jgi:hypothetical protein